MKADRILISKNIFTGVENKLISGAIAVKGNKIIAISDIEGFKHLVDENTKIKDFDDKLIMAGFCDSHLHLLLGALYKAEQDLSACKSAEECAKTLYENYEKRGILNNGEWGLGFSWYNLWWNDTTPPTKETLDKYFPNKPIFLLDADCHSAWVNTCALELCGVNQEDVIQKYPDITLDKEGKPSGYLSETEMKLCMKEALSLNPETEKNLLGEVVKELTSYGITSVNDMRNLLGQNLGNMAVYRAMEADLSLTCRINYATALSDGLDASIERQKQNNDNSLINYIGVKEFLDGIITTHTGLMLKPYANAPDADFEPRFLDWQQFEEDIIKMQANNLNIHIHATGDGAVHKCVEIYDKAVAKNGYTKSRFSIEHIDLSHPNDRKKMGKLGIVASVQPQHLTLSDTLETNPYPDCLDKTREAELWAFKDLQESGATLAFGTDYPIVGLNPFLGIDRAVNRWFDNQLPQEGWNEHSKVDVFSALRAYTYGGAYKNGKEDILGTLEVGKLADIIVLAENPFTMPKEDIRNNQVIYTMFNGREIR